MQGEVFLSVDLYLSTDIKSFITTDNDEEKTNENNEKTGEPEKYECNH